MKYDKVIDKAIEHAKDIYPRESCGFIYVFKGRLKYHRATNMATDADTFAIAPDEYAQVEALGEIVALVHSHPDASELPSVVDQRAHSVSGLDWVIIGLMDGVAKVHVMPAVTDTPPLMGRVFVHGVTDCYSFIRDWYAQNRGVKLLDFARADNWWERGENLYLDNFAKAGFMVVDEMQVGDVLLMTVGANVPNHGAVYVGDNIIEHHLYGRLSSREVYGQFYRERTTHVLRFKND